MNEVNEVAPEKLGEGDKLGQLPALLGEFLVIMLGSASLLIAIFAALQGDAGKLFVPANKLELVPRLTMLGVSWGLGALFAIVVVTVARRPSAPTHLRATVSTLCAPLIVSCFVPVLFSREAWAQAELGFLVFVMGVGLALERTLRPALALVARWWDGSRLQAQATRVASLPGARFIPLVVVLGLVLAYVGRVGTLANINHLRFGTSSSDLAEYDNLFFNALHGHPFRSPAIAGHLDDWNTLQGHAEFGLYMLLPFYALSPGAHALLWIQTAVIAATAIPVYLLGAVRLGRGAGLCFAAVFFMMPAVQRPNFYDFHFTPLAMFWVAWLLLFVAKLAHDPADRRARVGVFAAMALALLCREDISIGVAVLGAFLVLSGALVKDGLLLGGIATTYFFAMKFGIMPLFGKWWFDEMYQDLKADGVGGFAGIILTLISNPAFVLRTMLTEPKFLYVLHMTVPVLALWLRRPLLWMAFLPGLVATLLVTNRPPMYESSFQYTYLWVPYVIAASVVATGRGAKGGATLVALVMAGAALSHQLGVFPQGETIKGGFSQKTFEITAAERTRYRALKKLMALIPPEATVAATEAEGPHVSSRLIMYSLKYTLGPFPEYLLVGRVGHRGENAHVREALDSQKYGVIAQEDHFILAKRGADPAKNNPLWRKVGGRPRPPVARRGPVGRPPSGAPPPPVPAQPQPQPQPQ